MIRAKVRKKYQGLSRQELIDKAHELGYDFVKNSHSCSQSVLAAFHELLDIDTAVVRASTSSCGGQAVRMLGTCGALIGGTMALDYFFGRPIEDMSHTKEVKLDSLMEAASIAGLLYDRFLKEYRAIYCALIQQQLFGRQFYNLDPDDAEKFGKALRESSPNCFDIIGNVARWTMEILIDNEAVELRSH